MIAIAKTQYGLLRGVQKQGYVVFRGIPYAAPPVGPLRWRRPQPPLPWAGIREAKSFGPRAWQPGQEPGSMYQKEFYDDGDFMPPMDEDCLYLNIWTPAAAAEEKLPVALWIHGGAFVNGFSSEMEFDGEAYARRGVILVTLAYRLGALGFLVHPWLARPDAPGGNYGLYDALAALDWVRENIGAFGGDRDRITLFGQSAGAMATQALISSQLTRGKIAGAIFQSGGGYQTGFNRAPPPELLQETGEAFVREAGVSSREELLNLPAEKVLDAEKALFRTAMERGGLPFTPCADGVLLEAGGDDILAAGGHLDIPYMLGSTANDIGLPPGGDPRRDSLLYKGCIAFSLLQEKLGRKPAWVYYFSQKPQGDDLGAFHSAELWYMFGTLGRSWRPKTPGDFDLSSRMLSYWCNFIKQGDPNGPDLAEWQPCGGDGEFVLELKA
jgi:para-nitrobenzyl esterase